MAVNIKTKYVIVIITLILRFIKFNLTTVTVNNHTLDSNSLFGKGACMLTEYGAVTKCRPNFIKNRGHQ